VVFFNMGDFLFSVETGAANEAGPKPRLVVSGASGSLEISLNRGDQASVRLANPRQSLRFRDCGQLRAVGGEALGFGLVFGLVHGLLQKSPYAILKVSYRGDLMSILKVSIKQVKAARALLGWSQGDLAKASEISEPTIKRLEAGDGDLGGRAETAARIQGALESAGVQFIPENGGGAGVRLKK
jgi:DNA-binding XRE family transcriptional regulator